MANINVKSMSVENGAQQVEGDPFSVTVVVNNREMLNSDVFGGHGGCYTQYEGMQHPGHGADVTVEILQNGTKVDEELRHVCAPLDYINDGPPDPHVQFGPFDLPAGRYAVRATVTPDETGGPDTKTRTITVESESSAPPAGNGGDSGSGLEPWGDVDGDGVPNTLDPEPRNPDAPGGGGGSLFDLGSTDKYLAVVFLAIVAWALSSGADITESVT